jgi:hypothetical protein
VFVQTGSTGRRPTLYPRAAIIFVCNLADTYEQIRCMKMMAFPSRKITRPTLGGSISLSLIDIMVVPSNIRT